MGLIYKEEKSKGGDPFGFEEIETVTVHGMTKEYSEKILNDVVMSISGYTEMTYLGQRERISREVFEVAINKIAYTVVFVFDRDDGFTQLQVELDVSDQDGSIEEKYNRTLETLKVSLKDRLVQDWKSCTWTYDEQSELLCSDLYPQIFRIENRVREFANRVLIKHLGYNWIEHCGMEKYKESSASMGEVFKQSIPTFRDINATMLSVTLEILVDLLYKGEIYEKNLNIQYDDIKSLLGIAKSGSEENMKKFLEKKKDIRESIWNGIVSPYLADPELFQKQFTRFIKDRNHVAHNKLLTLSAYNIMQTEISAFDKSVKEAIEKFENDNPSEEVLETLYYEQEQEQMQNEYDESYWRDRINAETGVNIRTKDEIYELFIETVVDVKEAISDRYHLDECFDYTDENDPADSGETLIATVRSNAVEEERIEVIVSIDIDDDMDESSNIGFVAKHGDEIVAKAECHYHNGSGHEGSDGACVADSDSEYDTEELEDFKAELYEHIEEKLNPFVSEIQLMEASCVRDGGESPVADFPCEYCGKYGVSITEELFPIGKCCYCGNENEVWICELCGTVFNEFGGDGNICSGCMPKLDD